MAVSSESVLALLYGENRICHWLCLEVGDSGEEAELGLVLSGAVHTANSWFIYAAEPLQLKDSADVVGGEGMTLTFLVAVHLTNTSYPSMLLAIKSVNVKVDNLKFIRDSKHDSLYKTLRLLAAGLVKRQIQKAVGDGLRSSLEWVGEELVTVKERMNEAKANVKEVEAQGEIGRFKALQEMDVLTLSFHSTASELTYVFLQAFKCRRDDISVSGSSGGAGVLIHNFLPRFSFEFAVTVNAATG
ncbi:hypothetical protein VKT23_014676 [Stygiomarasmius scandens]|uniref:HAM1-like C-terminal domain-containing protein n=1 Tax=Marasmiellus scandens TaxID=2682957 RepID=A0ABR1J055_9AGAR